MVIPVKPAVPVAPSRARPSLFASEAETLLNAQQEVVNYMDAAAEFCDQEASNALSAAAFGRLTPSFLRSNPSKLVGINSAGTELTGYDQVPEVPLATLTDAEGGINNTKAMTPLRTKQALDKFIPAISGWQKIVTKMAESSGDIVFSAEFDASAFTDYRLVLRNLLPAADNRAIRMGASDDGGANYANQKSGPSSDSSWQATFIQLGGSIGAAVDETGLSASLDIFDLHADKGCMFIMDGIYVGTSGQVVRFELAGSLQRPSADGPINHLRFFASSGNLASGEITLYGVA